MVPEAILLNTVQAVTGKLPYEAVILKALEELSQPGVILCGCVKTLVCRVQPPR